jgi:hypothetical protein
MPPDFTAPATLKARLDERTGKKVLCGRPTCRGELADVNEIRNDDGLVKVRRLVIRPGWNFDPDARTLALSSHAAQDRRYRQSRGASPHEVQGKERWRRPFARARDREAGEKPYYPSRLSIRFPLIGTCPNCGFRSVLDPDELRITDPLQR